MTTYTVQQVFDDHIYVVVTGDSGGFGFDVNRADFASNDQLDAIVKAKVEQVAADSAPPELADVQAGLQRTI